MTTKEFIQALKKHKTLDAFARILYHPLFLLQSGKETRQAEERANGKDDPLYTWLKARKNQYQGKACFVVATGPSLRTADLELLRDVYSFSMNSCILSFGETSWRPDFYGIQDVYVYEKLKAHLEQLPAEELGEIWVGDPIQRKFPLPNHFRVYPLHLLDHKMYHPRGYGSFRFSDNCYVCVYDGYSVTLSLMQLACYLGFTEIYLLGCDCNYDQPKTHFKEYGYLDPKAKVMGDKLIAGHEAFRRFTEKAGVKVINCTRGGMLEAYPRMTLEAALAEIDQEKRKSSL